jgi:hypothetical protein
MSANSASRHHGPDNADAGEHKLAHRGRRLHE